MASFKSAVFAAMCFGSSPIPCPYPPPPPPTIADAFDAMANAAEPSGGIKIQNADIFMSREGATIYCNTHLPCMFGNTFHDSVPDAADIYRAIAKVFREHGDPR